MIEKIINTYVETLEKAYGKNLYSFMENVVEGGNKRKSPKNKTQLREYARRDILWNAKQGNVKEITMEFGVGVAEAYVGMSGCGDYLLDREKETYFHKFKIGNYKFLPHSKPEVLKEYCFEGYSLENAKNYCKEMGWEILEIIY